MHLRRGKNKPPLEVVVANFVNRYTRLLGFAGDMSVYVYGRVEVCIWKTIETVDNMHLFNMYQVCLKMI